MSTGVEYNYKFKLLLTGDSGVGKSSILMAFTDGMFAEDQPTTTGERSVHVACGMGMRQPCGCRHRLQGQKVPDSQSES